MALVTDIDFSFPKLTTKVLNNSNNESRISNSSPSIWRISSLVFPDEEEDAEREVTRKHRSFSEYESGESEARMDLLWQDFNEKDLKRTTSLDCRIKIRHCSGSGDFSGGKMSPDADHNICFRRDLNLLNKASEGRSSCNLARRPKRTSTVVLLRALRKLFFVHSLARNKKTL